MVQVLYKYYDLYNRGRVNFGGTLATGLVDVNPGAAAVRPVTMAARIAPYLRYYATRRPLDDHGVVPLVLVVFDDDLAAGHFLLRGGVAAGGPRRGRLKGPVRVRTDATDADWLPTLICQRLPRMPGPIRAGFVDGTRVEGQGSRLTRYVPTPISTSPTSIMISATSDAVDLPVAVAGNRVVWTSLEVDSLALPAAKAALSPPNGNPGIEAPIGSPSFPVSSVVPDPGASNGSSTSVRVMATMMESEAPEGSVAVTLTE